MFDSNWLATMKEWILIDGFDFYELKVDIISENTFN